MNGVLTPSGKKAGRKHESVKEICSFSLEQCLCYTNGKSGAGYICPFTLETFNTEQKETPCCQGLRISPRVLSRNNHQLLRLRVPGPLVRKYDAPATVR